MADRVDVRAAWDILKFVEEQTLEIGGCTFPLGDLYVDDDLKGLYKQIRTRVEQAIAEAFEQSAAATVRVPGVRAAVRVREGRFPVAGAGAHRVRECRSKVPSR